MPDGVLPMFGLGRVALRSLMGSKIPPAQAFADISSLVTPGAKKAMVEACMWTTGAAICAEGIRMWFGERERQKARRMVPSTPKTPDVDPYWLKFGSRPVCQETPADWTATGSSPVCFAGTGTHCPETPAAGLQPAIVRSALLAGFLPVQDPCRRPQQSDCIAQGRSPAAFGQGPDPCQEPQQSDCIAQGRSPAAFGLGSPTSLTSDSMVFLDWFIDEGRMAG
ncbi:hypothetical protein Bbelb_095380 [Branchiostoma belcheri]|nr:hypothetical protein Bbelb_095380 [Branchiostoma belcheri]